MDIKNFIAAHLSQYILLDWIPRECIDFNSLSMNPNAIGLLERNQDRINLEFLSKNTRAEHLLKQYRDRLPWHKICSNPAGYDIIKDRLQHVDIHMFQMNSHDALIDTILQDIDEGFYEFDFIDAFTIASICYLARNNNPRVMPLLAKYVTAFSELLPSRFSDDTDEMRLLIRFFIILSKNSNAVDILKAFPQFIYYPSLSKNESPQAAGLIEQYDVSDNIFTYAYMDNYIDFDRLSRNPAMMGYLKRNPSIINIDYLCENPNAIDAINNNLSESTLRRNVIHLVRNRSIHLFSDEIKKIIVSELQNNNQQARRELSKNPSIFQLYPNELWTSIVHDVIDIACG